tara:strand:+ start:7878 stop:9029 length:1152 start_codon:yes stop_codon:yes gene_type:complete
MFQNIRLFLNFLIIGSLILVFENIAEFSYFGFLYPWIGFILIFFVFYLFITMPFYFKKPKGLYTLLIGLIFILVQLITAQPEKYMASFVFISFIVISSIIVKNSDTEKLKVFLRIITYCCLINLIYGVFTIINGEFSLGTRIGGLGQAPVIFGYNMLLGFWLVLINSIINTNLKKSHSVLDKYFAFAFAIGIFLSQSWGAIFGLIVGISAIFFSQKKLNLKIFSFTILFGFVVLISIFYFPELYWDIFGFYRIVGKFNDFSEYGRYVMWSAMFKVYFQEISLLKLLFGGGQGYGTSLTGRGVHSDHFKILFDHGVLGLTIYYLKIISCLKQVKDFNIYIIGFVVSTLASGIFYVNFGSITNSFSYILVLIVLSNLKKIRLKKL